LRYFAEEAREQNQHAEEDADDDDAYEDAAFEKHGEWECGVHIDDVGFMISETR
jgi:hypothetical protein